MTDASLSESTVEAVALDWLGSLGWTVLHGPDIAPDTPTAERADYEEVVLHGRLRSALARLNLDLPDDALDDALRRLTRPAGATLEARNRDFHRMLVGGVTVEYADQDGRVRGAQVRVLDFDEPDGNDWLAVNQFTVVENRHERRPDIVLFVNGLPLAVMELKNPADENATVRTAFQQLQTYKAEIPSLFAFNAALIVSDGLEARIGTLTTGWEWFKPWRTIAGEALADRSLPQLQVLLEGVLHRRLLLALVHDFIVFEDDGGGALVKKMAGYHQFHAVQTAVAETLRAAALQQTGADSDPDGRDESGRQPGGARGDRRIGVIWHTQGSGKSLTMAFYAGRIAREPAMANPTVVVLTDRNDLDDQLFTTFSRCADLLGQPPEQASSRSDLRAKLTVQSGHVVFTTIQKFFPEEKGDRHPLLSSRRNIVVIADEAHRSQYDFIDGYARHMRDALPNASFIGFTGTPIEFADASTRAVFGDHISVYDVQRAVEDGATVPIYYESRLAKLHIERWEITYNPRHSPLTDPRTVSRPSPEPVSGDLPVSVSLLKHVGEDVDKLRQSLLVPRDVDVMVCRVRPRFHQVVVAHHIQNSEVRWLSRLDGETVRFEADEVVWCQRTAGAQQVLFKTNEISRQFVVRTRNTLRRECDVQDRKQRGRSSGELDQQV